MLTPRDHQHDEINQQDLEGGAMQDPVKFRKYAEECRRLAQTATGENRATLLQIADAWIACAEDAERTQQRVEAGRKPGPGAAVPGRPSSDPRD